VEEMRIAATRSIDALGHDFVRILSPSDVLTQHVEDFKLLSIEHIRHYCIASSLRQLSGH